MFLMHSLGLDVLFDILDEDGSGALGYIELRDGLRKMHTDPPVYMSLEDFEIMTRDVHALKGVSGEHAQVRTSGDRATHTNTHARARARAHTHTHPLLCAENKCQQKASYMHKDTFVLLVDGRYLPHLCVCVCVCARARACKYACTCRFGNQILRTS